MFNQKIRWIWFVLIWLFLSGCNSLLNSPTPAVSPTAQNTSTPFVQPTYTPSPTALSQLTKLSLWIPDFLDPYTESTGNALLNEQLTAFTEIYPEIQIQVIVKKSTGPGGLYNLLSTAYTAAPTVLPDLIVLNQADLQSAIDNELVQPLDSDIVDTSEFFPFSQESIQDDAGIIYGIPFVAQVDHMVYRSGIATQRPFSWTDVLTSGYSLLFPAASLEGLADDALLVAYLGTGGNVVDEQGSLALERDSLEQLYGFFSALIERNLINSERALALNDAAACWETYQQGIGRLSPVPAAIYWTAPPQGSAPSWVPTPDGRPLAIAHNWSIAFVTKESMQKDPSSQLMLWLTAPRQMGNFTRATVLLPTRQLALEEWGLLPEDHFFLSNLLQNALPELSPDIDVPVRRALLAGLRALLNRDVQTPEDAASYALTNLR